jgi:predicted ATPase/class 3 adenylate cyclase
VKALPTGTVTFLFTDVEGSTRLLHELGDAYADVLAEHRRVLRDAFARHGGVEVDTQGDAFFVAFARASDALAAAREASDALKDPIRVRIGVHTGEPLVTDEGYVGIDVHRAARIAAAGHGGQILVSQATRDLVGVDELRDLGEHRLKDLTAPERIYQLGDGEFPPLKTLDQTNLPVAASPLIGRRREAKELEALLRDSTRCITVTGAGGSGKTRLALEVAAGLVGAFGDGVWLVPLAALTEPRLVLPAVMQTIGVRHVDELRTRETLLLLDNLEHLLDAAPQLSELLQKSSRLKLLTTSRVPLRIAGEHEYVLEPLSEDDAVEFFLERSRPARPGLADDDEVRAICERLDRLPLALELASARLKLLDPASLLVRLEHRLPLLTGGRRDAPERQRTLRSTITWSFELLDPDAQRTFERLAVFAESFALEDAETVCGVDLDTLAALLDANLLKTLHENRFLMLETIREYASERLEASGEAHKLRRLHAQAMIVLAERSVPELDGPDQSRWFQRLGEDLGNLRSALEWLKEIGDDTDGIRLASALSRFWTIRGQSTEGRRWVRQFLAEDLPKSLRLAALRGLIPMLSMDDPDILSLAEERLQLARELGDKSAEVGALNQLLWAAGQRGDIALARSLFDEGIAVAGDLGNFHGVAILNLNLAKIERGCGNYDKADALVETAIALERQDGNEWAVALAVSQRGQLAVDRGEDENAASLFAEGLSLSQQLGYKSCLRRSLDGLAAVFAARGEAERASLLLGAADALLAPDGTPLPSREGDEDKDLSAAAASGARRLLGEEEYEAQRRKGRALGEDEAVELGLAYAAAPVD